MKTSTNGLIEIASHEGVCLDWYLDSVGVPTIGIGQTRYDGFDPRTAGTLTLQQAFDLFKRKIVEYERPVNVLGRTLSQTQFDALVSFCYNVGAGNLRRLCVQSRSLEAVGDAMVLYNKPPEIAARRKKEQVLFKTGRYSNDGRVLVFPVEGRKPRYSKGYTVDAREFFAEPARTAPVPAQTETPQPAATETKGLVATLQNLFRRS